jgi:hypothetical protein
VLLSLKRILLPLLVVVAVGCDEPQPTPPGGLDLGVRLRFKGSCGQVPTQYEAGCLAALQVLVTSSGRTLHEACVELDADDRPADLAGVVQLPPIKLATRDDVGDVIFEVRGVHDSGLLGDAGPGAICADNREVNWLFWGESKPTDLATLEDPATVEVRLDCRVCEDGCAGVGQSCPAVLPESYCVPFQVGFSCNRLCDDDSECFEGNILCLDQGGQTRCDPRQTPDGNTGGFCFPCEGPGDCDVAGGFTCVGPPGADTGVCTVACPFERCVNGALCQPLGNDLVRIE